MTLILCRERNPCHLPHIPQQALGGLSQFVIVAVYLFVSLAVLGFELKELNLPSKFLLDLQPILI
jgi:hypothetical protein